MKDEKLKSLIKQQVRQDAGNPYFTKKVLNRLPEKPRTDPCLWILRVAYLIAAIILGGFWLRLALHGEMFGKDFADCIVLWSLFYAVFCFGILEFLLPLHGVIIVEAKDEKENQ